MLRMHAVNSVGDEIDPASAEAILVNLRVSGALKPEESQLIASALSERSLKDVPPEIKGQVRASILKNMLMLCAGTGS